MQSVVHIGQGILAHDYRAGLPVHVERAKRAHESLQLPGCDVMNRTAKEVKNDRRKPPKGFPKFFFWCAHDNVVRQVTMKNPPILVRISARACMPPCSAALAFESLTVPHNCLQMQMTFLPELLRQHRLTLSPVPGPRLGSAIFRNWMKDKNVLDFENLLHSLVSAGKMNLGGFILPVRCSFCVQHPTTTGLYRPDCTASTNMPILLQRRQLLAACQGSLQAVHSRGLVRIAEVLDGDDLPAGRCVPSQTGRWMSFLGCTDDVQRFDPVIHTLCAPLSSDPASQCCCTMANMPT